MTKNIYERSREILERYHIRGLEIISRFLKKYAKMVSYRRWHGYTWQLRESQWDGLIPIDGTQLVGTLFALQNNKPMVVRNYVGKWSGHLHSYPFLQIDAPTAEHFLMPRYDGLDVQLFIDNEGQLWGKSHFIEYIDRNSRYNANIYLLLKMSKMERQIEQICRKNNAIVFATIISKYVPGGYVIYQMDADVIVNDIVINDEFLSPVDVCQMCEHYGLHWAGTVSSDDIYKNAGTYAKRYLPFGVTIEYLMPHQPCDQNRENLLLFWNDT